MWMMKAFEDLDFAVEVVLQLLVELREIDGLDSYESSRGLVCSSIDCGKASLAYFVLNTERSHHFVTRPRPPG